MTKSPPESMRNVKIQQCKLQKLKLLVDFASNFNKIIAPSSSQVRKWMHSNVPTTLIELLPSHYVCVGPGVVLREHYFSYDFAKADKFWAIAYFRRTIKTKYFQCFLFWVFFFDAQTILTQAVLKPSVGKIWISFD